MSDLPRDPGHPRSLAARRLLSDETVQDFFREITDQLTVASIQSMTVENREAARHQVMALMGLKQTLEAFAIGDIPTSLRTPPSPLEEQTVQ